MFYPGIDVSKKSSRYVLLNPEGQKSKILLVGQYP
jgi:hypothetical protein